MTEARVDAGLVAFSSEMEQGIKKTAEKEAEKAVALGRDKAEQILEDWLVELREGIANELTENTEGTLYWAEKILGHNDEYVLRASCLNDHVQAWKNE